MSAGMIFVSYALSALSGICFVTGLALLSDRRK